jgi:hypothetical protein
MEFVAPAPKSIGNVIQLLGIKKILILVFLIIQSNVAIRRESGHGNGCKSEPAG